MSLHFEVRITLTASFDNLDSPLQINAYRPFYASMRLPPSVKRGEAVAVELVVFNNGVQNTSVTVTIHNDNGDFLFPDFSNEIDQGCKKHLNNGFHFLCKY